MEQIDDFCSDPTVDNFKNIEPKIQQLFYTLAQDATEKNIGNLEIAKKVTTYYFTQHLNEAKKRGLQALLLAIKHLPTITRPPPLDDSINPMIKVYTRGKHLLFNIDYYSDPYLPRLFKITETTEKGIPIEAMEDLDGAKDHVISTVGAYKIMITRIDIEFPDRIWRFYMDTVGIIWDNEECIGCALEFPVFNCSFDGCDDVDERIAKEMQKKQKGFSKCRELLVNDACLSKIRHHPAKFDVKNIV